MVKTLTRKLKTKTHDLLFSRIHGGNLIYNACWEDPRIDRQLMRLGPEDKIVMITSAGCNLLDYLLDSPAEIHSVDMNPRQNALLELKMLMIRHGNFDDLFKMFGEGCHPKIKPLYKSLCSELSPGARKFWDQRIYFFTNPKIRSSFYYHGAAGNVAWLVRQFLKTRKKLRDGIFAAINAKNLEEQRELYEKIDRNLFNSFIRWMLKSPVIMAMLGVPRAQIQLIKNSYPGGLVGYVRDKLKHVFTELPTSDNYFWRVYLTGSYTRKCCPNYLKEENQAVLKENLDRVRFYNMTMTEFIQKNPGPYTNYILLDHQDWLAAHDTESLEEEWREILASSAANAKIIMRSAGTVIDFLPDFAASSIAPKPGISDPLHRLDRVGTYGCLLFAEVKI